MTFNRMHSLNNRTAFKNSDKPGRISFVCYSVNTSKRWKHVILAQVRASKRHKIIRRYEGVALKNMRTDMPHLSSTISNQKQTP